MLYGKRFFLEYQTDSIMALADTTSTFQTQASKQTILASPFFLTRNPWVRGIVGPFGWKPHVGIHLKVGEMDLGTWRFFFVRLSVGIRQAQMDAHWSERSQGASSTR